MTKEVDICGDFDIKVKVDIVRDEDNEIESTELLSAKIEDVDVPKGTTLFNMIQDLVNDEDSETWED